MASRAPRPSGCGGRHLVAVEALSHAQEPRPRRPLALKQEERAALAQTGAVAARRKGPAPSLGQDTQPEKPPQGRLAEGLDPTHEDGVEHIRVEETLRTGEDLAARSARRRHHTPRAPVAIALRQKLNRRAKGMLPAQRVSHGELARSAMCHEGGLGRIEPTGTGAEHHPHTIGPPTTQGPVQDTVHLVGEVHHHPGRAGVVGGEGGWEGIKHITHSSDRSNERKIKLRRREP
jgi:hypothetical protein